MLTRQAVRGAKAANLLAHCSLLALKPRAVAFVSSKLRQEAPDQCRNRCVLLGGSYVGHPVGLIDPQ
jgi:hypothetical protein